jgi:hypothetical protein
MPILIDTEGARSDPETFYWDLRAVQSATELLADAYRDRIWNTNDLLTYYGPWRDRNIVDVLAEDITSKLRLLREAVDEGVRADSQDSAG